MPLRLLIIDDDEIDRMAVRRALTSAALDFEMTEADSATAGLEAARGAPHDCILLDYLLPGQTGFDVLRALRSAGATTPIVMLTGHGDEDLAVELMKAGASDYLPKAALNPLRLVQSVRHVVSLSRMQEEARQRKDAHAAQLRALANAAIDLNAVLSADAVLERVTASARALVAAETATARVVRPSERRGAARPPAGDAAALASAIGALRAPLRAAGEALPLSPQLAYLVALGLPPPRRSWLAAPLVGSDGTPIGLIHVCDGRAGNFTTNDEAILVQLAQMASIALENSWLYEAAHSAVRARDDMIAIVSHDLRSPLNTMMMGASMLKDDRLAGRADETIKRMNRAAERMNRLVNDLLDMTRIDAGTLSIAATPQPLEPIVEEALDQLRPSAKEKKIALGSRCDSPLPWASVDRHRLFQALSNLLGNAIKFTAPGGSVMVAVERVSQGLRLKVHDTGVGISADHLPQLFDRYWQAKETSNMGAGLGLFITKGIIDAHGSTLTVESTPGVGTTFAFVLACVPAPEGGIA